MKEISPEKVAQMTPENRMRYEKKMRQVKIIRKILAFLIIILLVAAVAAVLSLTVLFNISSIEIENKKPVYSQEEIIDKSGLDVGDNMIRTDFEKAGLKIQEALPYVKKAEIIKNLSGKVLIKIQNDIAVFVSKSESGYVVLDEDGKVLEITEKRPEKMSLTEIKDTVEFVAKPGKFAVTGKQAASFKIIKDIYNGFKSAKLAEKITRIDISSRESIVVIYENRFRIKFGNIDNIGLKIAAVNKVISMEEKSYPGGIGEINAQNYKKVYFDPLESLQEEVSVIYKKPLQEEISEQAADESDAQEEDETETENEENTDSDSSAENTEESESGDNIEENNADESDNSESVQ